MKKHFTIFFIFIAIIANAQDKKVITNLSSADFKTMLAGDKQAVLIDLRTTDEMVRKGYIKGALQIDFLAKNAEQQLNKLDKNKTYYVYCAAGGRSADAAEYMERQGFKKIYNLEKGFSDWSTKGFPVEKK